MASKKKKQCLKFLDFRPHKLKYEFERALVRVEPGMYTDVFYNPEIIEPGSCEFWEIALRAGWISFQFEQGLQLGGHTYSLYENKKPRAPRTAKTEII